MSVGTHTPDGHASIVGKLTAAHYAQALDLFFR